MIKTIFNLKTDSSVFKQEEALSDQKKGFLSKMKHIAKKIFGLPAQKETVAQLLKRSDSEILRSFEVVNTPAQTALAEYEPFGPEPIALPQVDYTMPGSE